MKKAVTNWTSTEVPMWQTDCIEFWRAGFPFEVRNVTGPEQKRFIETFAGRHRLAVHWEGSSAILSFRETVREEP